MAAQLMVPLQDRGSVAEGLYGAAVRVSVAWAGEVQVSYPEGGERGQVETVTCVREGDKGWEGVPWFYFSSACMPLAAEGRVMSVSQ